MMRRRRFLANALRDGSEELSKRDRHLYYDNSDGWNVALFPGDLRIPYYDISILIAMA